MTRALSEAVSFFAGVGACALIVGAYLVADYNTRRAEHIAQAQEHRTNTPRCDATVRQRDIGGKWSDHRCTKGRYEPAK